MTLTGHKNAQNNDVYMQSSATVNTHEMHIACPRRSACGRRNQPTATRTHKATFTITCKHGKRPLLILDLSSAAAAPAAVSKEGNKERTMVIGQPHGTGSTSTNQRRGTTRERAAAARPSASAPTPDSRGRRRAPMNSGRVGFSPCRPRVNQSETGTAGERGRQQSG